MVTLFEKQSIRNKVPYLLQVPTHGFSSLPRDTYAPFYLHNELACQIKLSLRPCTGMDRNVRIGIPLDHFLITGGLQQGEIQLRS